MAGGGAGDMSGIQATDPSAIGSQAYQTPGNLSGMAGLGMGGAGIGGGNAGSLQAGTGAGSLVPSSLSQGSQGYPTQQLGQLNSMLGGQQAGGGMQGQPIGGDQMLTPQQQAYFASQPPSQLQLQKRAEMPPAGYNAGRQMAPQTLPAYGMQGQPMQSPFRGGAGHMDDMRQQHGGFNRNQMMQQPTAQATMQSAPIPQLMAQPAQAVQAAQQARTLAPRFNQPIISQQDGGGAYNAMYARGGITSLIR